MEMKKRPLAPKGMSRGSSISDDDNDNNSEMDDAHNVIEARGSLGVEDSSEANNGNDGDSCGIKVVVGQGEDWDVDAEGVWIQIAILDVVQQDLLQFPPPS